MKKLLLNPNEMAIRKIYWPLVLSQEISTFFRPGRRLCENVRGYCENQNIKLRCIVKLGSDSLGLAPVFDEKSKVSAKIKHIYDKKISELREEDFLGSSPDIKNSLDLKYQLGLIYDLDLDPDSYVTIIKVDYDKQVEFKTEPKRLENLLQSGMFKISELAKDNASDMQSPELMLTLISHDYPARTPQLWNYAFSHFKINAKSLVLVPADTEINQADLQFTFAAYKDDQRFKLGGLGVGFKDESINSLDLLDDSAANVGAANFVLKNEEAKLVGYNTDGEGFVSGLAFNFPNLENLKEKKILLLGSGGTANAIAFALAKKGAKLIIANRTLSKAQALAGAINKFYESDLAKAISEGEIEKFLNDIALLINSSTKGAAGTFANYLAISETASGLEENLKEGKRLLSLIQKDVVIADVVLREEDTPLISEAKRQGFKTIDGLPMVISQAALAFTLSYGKSHNIAFADVYQVMKEAIK